MRKFVTVLSLVFCAFAAFTQDKIPAFGKPVMEELLMKECDFEKTADAVKLLDYQEKNIIVDNSTRVKTERIVKIKIFNRKGFSFANITIPYISRIKGTKITDINAYIHYLDATGKVVTEKVSKKQIFRDREDEKVKKIKFTFPNVKEGCVIEYRYEKTEKNSLHLEPWVFQDLIPTKRSHFKLIMPSLITFDKRIIGVDSLLESSKRSNSTLLYTEKIFELKNVASFKVEPMMTSLGDNMKRIEFALYPPSFRFLSSQPKRWKLLASLLNELPLLGKQYEVVIPGTQAIIDTAIKLEHKEDKINYIFNAVKREVSWDNQQTFYAGDITEAWKEKSGNSAEINLLILNLLRKAKVQCSPILISTRENGQIDEAFFSLAQFDGLNVLISDSSANYILDGTRKYQSFQTPPANILNRNVYNIDTANSQWLFVSDQRPLLKTIMFVQSNLTDENKITGKASVMSYDHSKVQRMTDLKKTEEDEQKEEKEFLQKDFAELKIDSLVLKNQDNDREPLQEDFNFSYTPSASGDFIFIDPLFLSNFRKNPFQDSIRRSSIDFTSRQYLKTTVMINIPASYDVELLPKNIRLKMQDSTILFERRVYKNDTEILFINTLEILQPVFSKDEYPGLRDYFNRLYGMLTEQIILKRKK